MLKINSLHDLHEEEVLEQLVSGGETSTLEFKSRLPSIDTTAKLISSFANTDGGIILFGINDDASIQGIENIEGFNDFVMKSFVKTDPGISGYSSGIVYLKDKPIGCIIVWPRKGLPIAVDSKFYRRVGASTVQFNSSEIDKVINDREELAELFISSNEILNFINSASEDQFIEILLVPIMRKMGFVGVSPKGHSDKSLEFGQDVRCFKYQLPTGHWLYFAAQVKAGKISYSPTQSERNIEQILTQVRMAQNKEMYDFEANSYHKPDHVLLIASGKIVEGARIYLCQQLYKSQNSRILFWDSNLIQERAEKTGLPNGVQFEIRNFANKNNI
ncbi:ATP-binding protein [Desulfobacter postgatei]|uniref:AlbA family DNA-binding domain-containing protein n=1 Tax=Desulfobacter postgatei TaxID=2293 RepID=UPI00259B4986|nr:ATP-binding protein [uncultured Desulfobacter sp.]